ncbi:MAG: SRPBCC family protein, partial [Chloroflexi bacterium]|nr:SRPBCC family protein [Chloroflexota bacterium]
MIRIKHSIVIDRPLDDVFEYLAAPWNMPEWQGGGPRAAGVGGAATVAGGTGPGGRRPFGRRSAPVVG